MVDGGGHQRKPRLYRGFKLCSSLGDCLRAFTPVAGVVLVRAPKAAAPGIITLRRSVIVCPQSGHIDKLTQSASSGAPATQRFGRFISCGESCFAICRRCFAIAGHALGSSRCEAPTARWKRQQSPASGEGEVKCA